MSKNNDNAAVMAQFEENAKRLLPNTENASEN